MTIIAVAISVSLLISMLSIAEGYRITSLRNIQKSKEDVLITAVGTAGISDGHNLSTALRNDVNITEASPILLPFDRVLSVTPLKDENRSSLVFSGGIIPKSQEKFLIDGKKLTIFDYFEVEFDDWFPTKEDKHFNNNYTGEWTSEALIDEILASNLGLEVGDKILISSVSIFDFTNVSEAHVFTVEGIFKTDLKGSGVLKIFQGFIVLHLSELQDILGGKYKDYDMISGLSLSLTQEKKGSGNVERIALDLKERYPYYQILTKKDKIRQVERETAMSNAVYMAIGIVALIIGLLFVISIMLMSIFERTNEIGVMRAIGISRKHIFTQIFLESLLIVLIGALIGLLPAYYGSILISNFISESYGIDMEFTAFTPELIARSMIEIVGIGSLASLFPAWRTMKIEIVEALRRVR